MAKNTNAFDGENLLVCEKRCDQCLFSSAKVVDEHRKQDLLKKCAKTGSYFLCHKSYSGKPVVCRGFFDEVPSQACRVAQRLNLVKFVKPGEPK